MVLELHLWGPAFGLPSINPECIATVAYFNRIVPQGLWTLLADYDTSISPQGDVPVLVDGGVKISGFSSIVSYLRNHHSGAYDLDYSLTHQQQTDRSAFISFLESTAGPLLDLYLFVSSANYNTTTSSAFTEILPWYANYVIPPKCRNLAIARTAHLGLTGLDANEAGEDTHGPGSGTASSEYEAAKRAAGIPSETQPNVLSMGRGKGLGGLLSAPIYAARFKLDALSNCLFEPLSDLLGKKDYLLEGEKPSSLDCLAFGYISLMLYPPVPQAWLKETIQTKYPRIARYIRRLREELLGSKEVNAAEVWSISSGQQEDAGLHLPWRPSPSRQLGRQPKAMAREILAHIPLLSRNLQRGASIQEDSIQSSTRPSSALPSPTLVNVISALSIVVTAGLAGLAIHHRRSPREGPLIFWALRPSAGLSGFGEAESFLSVLANQLP